MKNQFFRRKRSLIDRKLQLSLAWMTFGYMMLYTFFLLVIFGFPIWMILHITEGTNTDRMAAVGTFIVNDHLFWMLLSLFVIIVSLHSITVSRKIAGPIFVLRRHLKRARGGELSRLSFRSSDHFQDIKDLINDHFDNLADTGTALRNQSQNLNKLFGELKSELSATLSGNDKATGLMERIADELKELEDNGKAFWTYAE